MRPLFKYAALGAACLLLALGAGVYLTLNSLIRAAIETAGPRLTQTAVKVDSVLLLPLSGRARLGGLFIGNPRGFRTDYAFKARSLSVAISPKSLLTDTIVIRKIEADGPEISFEGSPSANNLTQIQHNIQSFAPASSKAEKSGPGKKIIIDRLIVRGAHIKVSSKLLPSNGLEVTPPDINLEGIGRKSHGVRPDQAASEVFAALTRSITNAALAPISGLGKAAQGVEKNINKTMRTLFH